MTSEIDEGESGNTGGPEELTKVFLILVDGGELCLLRVSVVGVCEVHLVGKVALECILELVSVEVIEESAERVVDPVCVLLSMEESVVLSLGKTKLQVLKVFNGVKSGG